MVWFKLDNEEGRSVRISIDRSRQEIMMAALRARDAGLVDQAYASMVTLVELLHEEDEELTADERQLLSLCVKLFIDKRRSTLSAVSEREEQEQDPQEKQALHQAKVQVSVRLPNGADPAVASVHNPQSRQSCFHVACKLCTLHLVAIVGQCCATASL
jgi:hypothetical protein